ncbi:MAG: FAD-dependent oxidoreductase [Nitrospirae bacterium]|nr:FAD-dependent oxidoreductase [Nitrospirota bacterium]
MTVFDFDIGILGGGAAGLTVASGAAQFGASTLLIEKERHLGGDCLHFGCVPSKTLIRTASVYHLMKNPARFGLPEIEVRPVDFGDVKKRIQSVIRAIQEHDSEERFCGLGVKVEFGDAFFADEHSVRINNRTWSARSWVIATGSSPSVPQLDGLDKTSFVTNRELFSLDSLPKSMIVLGAGPVAIEMAQAFSRLGTKVTVVQRGRQILSREDKDVADLLMSVMISEGVVFQLGSAVVAVKDQGSDKEVVIKKSDGNILALRAEKLLLATGRSANLDGLGLEGLSLDYDKKGLKVDGRLRTRHKHIYAAGDVTGEYQFTHAAGYEGGIVLSNAVLRLPRKADYTLMPWCTYTDPELAGIGMNETRARSAGIKYDIWLEKFSANDRSLAEGHDAGIVKMLLDERERPLGVQIFGPHAGELISEWVAALNGGVRLTTLAAAVHPYPTLAETNKKVAGRFLSGKIFSGRVKKALRFFFGLKGRACG